MAARARAAAVMERTRGGESVLAEDSSDRHSPISLSLRRRWLAVRAAVTAWYERDRDNHAMLILLALFVVVWTSFQIIVFSAIGLNDDLTEVFVWSQHPAAGYAKHPPLAGLIAAAWFAVFPLADWSFHLLAMVNSAVALFAVDCIARRYVSGDKRLLVFFLLLLTPFYQFHGQRFSSNLILLSTWPIATYCFLRAYETRALFWAALTGVTAALAMLGKYYSIYLIAAFVVAAFWHPRRFEYLRSASPWVSVLCGLAVLAPHLHWLATFGPTTVRYAISVHASHSIADEVWATLEYAVGGVAYVLLPIGAYVATVRPDRRMLAAALWPDDPDRRMLVVLLMVPLVAPLLTAPIIGVRLTSLWTMSGWFLLPIVLLAPSDVKLTRAAALRVPVAVALITAAVFVAAPVIAWRNFVRESERGRAYYRVASTELTREWRTTMRRPLTMVSGDVALTHAVGFYSPDHPDTGPDFSQVNAPWISDDRRARQGWAGICFAEESNCVSDIERSAAGASGVVRVEKELTVSFFGIKKASVPVVFLLVPPQR